MLYNPRHPGFIIKNRILPKLNLSVTAFAKKMNMSRTAVSRIINGKAQISADFAVKLEYAGIGNKRHWMQMQINHNLYKAYNNDENKITQFI